MRKQLFQYILKLNRNKIVGKAIFQSIYLFLRVSGKRIKWDYEGNEMIVPVNHSLPQNMSIFPGYSLNFKTVVKKSCIEKDKTIIDIGANIGDTVALIRPVTASKIVCIEGDEKYLELLKINTSKDSNCIIIHSFLGEKDESLNTKQVHENGTGRLIQDGTSKMEIRSLDSLLLPRHELQIGLIKIDTDGFDNKIIRGAEGIIEKFHPVIFFEYDPHFLEKAGEIGTDIFDFLVAKGYTSFEMYDNLGDLICTCTSADKRIFEDLHQYFSGKSGRKYMDIAAYAS